MSILPSKAKQYTSGLPNRVKVGPIEYQVILGSGLKAQLAEGEEVPVFGMVNFKNSEIAIDEELSPMMQWQCFWHELVHIIFEQLGLDEGESEGQIDALAYKLLEILIDNRFLQFPAPETAVIRGYSPYEIKLAHGE